MLKRYRILANKIVEATEEKSPILIFVNPDETERRNLIDNYKIDEHTLRSALDPDELSWLEFEPNHTALIFKRPKSYSAEDQLLFKTTTAGMFLFSDCLIIVLTEDINLFEGKFFAKVSSLPEMMLKVIYASIFHFLGHLKVINMMADEIEEKINRSMENKYLINLFTLQKSLVYYLNAINSNSLVIGKLKLSANRFNFNQEQSELIEDIIIENTQCYQQAEIYSNILANLMDARVSVVSNNLNILMKLLTIVMIAIMVPTLVVSFFSMNVRLPMENLSYAFWIIMGLAAVAASCIFFILRYKRW